MSQPDKRKSTQTRISPPKLSRNVSNNATKNHQKRLQGMIGLLTILGGAQILMLLLANPSSNENTLAYIFIILNGLQGCFLINFQFVKSRYFQEFLYSSFTFCSVKKSSNFWVLRSSRKSRKQV